MAPVDPECLAGQFREIFTTVPSREKNQQVVLVYRIQVIRIAKASITRVGFVLFSNFAGMSKQFYYPTMFVYSLFILGEGIRRQVCEYFIYISCRILLLAALNLVAIRARASERLHVPAWNFARVRRLPRFLSLSPVSSPIRIRGHRVNLDPGYPCSIFASLARIITCYIASRV